MAQQEGVYARTSAYLKDVAHEMLYKVSWPTWPELQNSAMLVMVAAIIFSLIIFVMDFIFGANPENGIFQGILYYIYSIFA